MALYGGRIQITAASALAIGLFLHGCRSTDEDAARLAAEHWMELVDDGRYDESWTQASRRMQTGVSKKFWADGVREHQGKLGRLLSRKLIKQEYAPQFNIGDGIVADCARFVFEESYENRTNARHSVAVMREPDGVWRVYVSLVG
jgi:hypothetical protein